MVKRISYGEIWARAEAEGKLHRPVVAPTGFVVSGPTGIPGGSLLDEVYSFLVKYVDFPKVGQADAVTLWVAHTHAFDAAETTPRLAIQSLTPQSGKTRLLELLEMLVANPITTSSISPAALFRCIADEDSPTPTILIDEIDAVFSAKGKGKEDLRGLLNAGYKRGALVVRMAASRVEKCKVFAPVALAGIGQLPETVQDRSIVIALRRSEAGTIAKLRRSEAAPDAFMLHSTLHEWAVQNMALLATARPVMPDCLSDRATDIWEPLFAIADRVGGEWPARATEAATALFVPSGTKEEK